MTVQEDVKGKNYLKASEVYVPGEPDANKKGGYFVPHFDISCEQAKSQGWHYKLKAGGKMRITHYSGTEREVVVPHSIGGYAVNELGAGAFANTKCGIVFLPDSIVRIGEGCFSESSIRRAVLPDGISDLPEKCFFACKQLESVRLPERLDGIGTRAFMYCEKLRYFAFTFRMHAAGGEVFRASGLEGFSIEKGTALHFDGSCFADTPLHRKYDLITAPITGSMYDYRVLLVGSMKTVRFPKGSNVIFNEGCIQHGCTLDLSECSSVDFEYGAFKCTHDSWGIINSHCMVKLMMPHTSDAYVPYYASAYYPGGSKYPYRSWFTDVQISGNSAAVKPRKSLLPEFCATVHAFDDKRIENLLIDCGAGWTKYEPHAIANYHLRSVEIKGNIYGSGRLFADSCCNLEKVTFNQYTVYIPTVDREVHKYLLGAFCEVDGKRCRCFDSSVYDRVFTEPPEKWGNKSKKRLSQRELIMFAADVLRSSPSLFENRQMYEKYLASHKRYAMILCEKLPEEYSAYLKKYYEVGTVPNAKRGFMPTDGRDFSEKALPILRKAAEEVGFLLNRGYPTTSATRFIGDHYQLSERQRLALARTLSPLASVVERKSRQVTDIAGENLYIDGFNAIIGLEIACSQSMLFRCMDGTVRDLAGLHGTYRLIPQTDEGIKLLMKALSELKVAKAVIYLDKPVSNSGRLKQRIYELAEDIPFELEVLTEDSVDSILKTKPLIASADAIILDECSKWFNLNRYIVDNCIGSYPYVDIVPSFE
ncbi:MAG: DUF434 domain-containing protein [Ruminococcus sp.]|nr:DUF434 domain-containing protein [Ruminococcus sp.]